MCTLEFNFLSTQNYSIQAPLMLFTGLIDPKTAQSNW